MPGYRDPPAEHRFKKGQSGNPTGGPQGPRQRPLQRRCKFLDEKIRCTIGGKPFNGQRREALVRAAVALAITKSNFGLQQLLLRLKAQVDEKQRHICRDQPLHVIKTWPASPRSVSCVEDAAEVAGFGTKAYRNQKSARVLLENWVVEDALERLGDRRLTRDEQMQVLAAIRFPKKMNWPDWWQPDLRERRKGWRAPQAAKNLAETKTPDTVRISLMDYMVQVQRERLRREEIEYAREYRAMSPEDQELFRKPFERPDGPSGDGQFESDAENRKPVARSVKPESLMPRQRAIVESSK